MVDSPRQPNGRPEVRGFHLPNPWSLLARRREERFQRRRRELLAYLEVATPLALDAGRLYQEWRDCLSEPIQDGQKAANQSAIYWWEITDRLGRFEQLSPPSAAAHYHKRFAEALRSASEGAEIVKSGFRSNKYSEVSRGLGLLDRYIELMAEAEQEVGRLVREYGLVQEG